MSDTRTAQEQLFEDHGLAVETVGDILDEKGSEGDGSVVGLGTSRPFDPPRLESYNAPALQPGIHFGVSEADYHAFPALSNHGIKEMAASPMIYWSNSRWMNPDWEEREEKEHFNLGHAYECRVLEGPEAFARKYAVNLDKRDHPNALVTLDDIKAKLEDYGLKAKKSKGESFDLLKELDPDVELWDRLVEEHLKANANKTMISAKAMKRIEITARIVELDPEHKAALSGGYPQVTLVWYCAKTGVLKKARPDYMKLRAILDAKTLVNQRQRDPQSAAFAEMADRKYTVQTSMYLEGANAVRKLVREHGLKLCFHHDEPEEVEVYDRNQWVEKWATEKRPIEWLWLFMQTAYPITRLIQFPIGGTSKAITDEAVSRHSRRFRLAAETYGTDPWLDIEGLIKMTDEDLHPRALEI